MLLHIAVVLKLCQDVKRATHQRKPIFMGCADRVIYEGKSWLLDFDSSLSTGERNTLKARLQSLRSIDQIVEIEATVSGNEKREDGHFPNPMATFDVFKLTALSVETPSAPHQ